MDSDLNSNSLKMFLYKSLWVFFMSLTLTCETVKRTISSLYYFCTSYFNPFDIYNSLQDIQFIERSKMGLTKVPKHMSIVIGSENLPHQVLSKIAVYALIADIDYISFYDIKEEFSLDDVKIPQYVSSHKMHNGRFIWSMPNDKKQSRLLKYKNGMEKSIEVLNLSHKEGKPLLAEICQDFFQKKDKPEIQNALKDNESLSQLISDKLRQKLNNLPDVDLAVIFNRNMCTFGLLPWHTGFTEFHLIESGNCFNVQKFAEILYKFSKCEQRFGK